MLEGYINLYLEQTGKRFELEAEHDRLMSQWSDLPTPKAKEKTKARFTELEERIESLRLQQKDGASVVEQHWREVNDLSLAIADAKIAMESEMGEHALRQRAEVLRAVIERIECTFVATGESGGGWGKKNSKLVKITSTPSSENR